MRRRSFAEVVKEGEALIYGGRELERRAIGGDGNCQFRAFSWWIYGTEGNHAVVRRQIVNYVCQKWSRFSEQVMLCYPQCITPMSYLGYMGSEKVYGGQLEIVVASELYRRPILVYNKVS